MFSGVRKSSIPDCMDAVERCLIPFGVLDAGVNAVGGMLPDSGVLVVYCLDANSVCNVCNTHSLTILSISVLCSSWTVFEASIVNDTLRRFSF